MRQVVGVMLGGGMFLAVVAEFELRHSLRTGGAFGETRVWGWTAAALIMMMAVLICLLLAASEA